MKHHTEWCAQANKYRCVRCGRSSKYVKMPGKCTLDTVRCVLCFKMRVTDGPGSALVTQSRHFPWFADRLSLLHSNSPYNTCAHWENTWHVARCGLSFFGHDVHAESEVVGAFFFHWIAAASFVQRLEVLVHIVGNMEKRYLGIERRGKGKH